MPAFFLALIAAALATLAGREAVRVARLAHALGPAIGLLAALWLAAIGSTALAGYLGALLAPQLQPNAKHMLVALALALAAIELVVLRPGPAPAEPTRSFPAILIVLLAALLIDASRLLVLAIAAANGAPKLAAAGGIVGSVAVLTAAWALRGEWERVLPIAALRWGVAALMLVAALVTGLTARGLLG